MNLLDRIIIINSVKKYLEEELKKLKGELLDKMETEGASEVVGEYGKGIILDFNRGILNEELTQDILDKFKTNEISEVDISECKKITECHYLLARPFKDVPTPEIPIDIIYNDERVL